MVSNTHIDIPQVPVILAPGDWNPLLAVLGTCTHIAYSYMGTYTFSLRKRKIILKKITPGPNYLLLLRNISWIKVNLSNEWKAQRDWNSYSDT